MIGVSFVNSERLSQRPIGMVDIDDAADKKTRGDVTTGRDNIHKKYFNINNLNGGGGGIRTHVRKPSDRSSYMLIPSFSSHPIRRLGESSGIGQPGFSRLPAPDEVGKTSLMFDVPSAAQAPTGRRASLN